MDAVLIIGHAGSHSFDGSRRRRCGTRSVRHRLSLRLAFIARRSTSGLATASKPGGLTALHSRPATGRPRSLTRHTRSNRCFVGSTAVIRVEVWSGFWLVDAVCGSRPDRAEIRHSAWRDGGGRTARQVGTDTAKAAAAQLTSVILKRLRRGSANGILLPLPDGQKPRAGRCISGMTGRAFVPIACTARPGAGRVKRLWSNALVSGSRSVRPPAVNARGGFWYCTYRGGLSASKRLSRCYGA